MAVASSLVVTNSLVTVNSIIVAKALPEFSGCSDC